MQATNVILIFEIINFVVLVSCAINIFYLKHNFYLFMIQYTHIYIQILNNKKHKKVKYF